MRPLKALFGMTPIAAFGVDALEAVRSKLLADERRLSRSTINKRIECIRRMFRWRVEKRLVSPAVCGALLMLKGLKRFRSDAREPEPVKPVAIVHVEATLPYLNPTLAGDRVRPNGGGSQLVQDYGRMTPKRVRNWVRSVPLIARSPFQSNAAR